MAKRKFKFPGDDEKYTEFLETWLLRIQDRHGPSCMNPCKPEVCDQAAKGSQHVNTTSQLAQLAQGTGQRWTGETEEAEAAVPKWQKQLDKFVDGMPRALQWEEARKDAGLHTPLRNQQAIKLILGHSNTALFHPGWHAAALSSISPVGSQDLVVRGCLYGNFIARCAEDHNFAGRVVAFQNLVFCSYCVVMMGAGIPKKITNDMMRQYTGRERDDLTLEKYRHGAIWVNRCIASLLLKGWGHKSWEFFLLNSRSTAQFSRFAASASNSYMTVADKLGSASIPLWEDAWIPYCIPCIVQHLTGNSVPLADIWKTLGYGQFEFSYAQNISGYFNQCLNYMLANDSMPAALVGPQPQLVQ